jgi:murein DD-endopeptidase MepM/ murein hydrolase activator NlpD
VEGWPLASTVITFEGLSDGRVSFKGTRGGYGNAIVLAHSNCVSTLYGHMSRFAGNVRVGSHVDRGQIIGYVGMSGLAIGPHLHYEHLSNGVHMNPQTVRLPAAHPLQSESLAQFQAVAAPLLAGLSAEGRPAVVRPPATVQNSSVARTAPSLN